MAQIIRLLDYEPVERPKGFRPTAPAKILFFTGVRYERVPKKKTKRSKNKASNKRVG